MALLKCKMCGGSLEVTAGATIIECEYCGTQQTLPKTTDESVQSLFNRANLLRQKNEFDKAEAVYEKIIEADETEAEAYWGVILCKFGIEYVEDPKTYKRIPTCHRTSYDSIVADEYYKKALEYADITQRSIYEREAKQIDEIQKGILAIATNEEPYDVFICYKETDADGKRTQDSVIANDIYHQLTQEGFKVFYAAITLEDKLGSAYEPIIFAALNSAKVMLSIGTKPEYFNAVWVKNEWSRFLKMMKKDRSKMLIPCYKGMDAYELPEEFAHLQAQDMGKIGFINDIVRGIKKVIVKDEPKTTVVKETAVTKETNNTAPLLKRAFLFLEDGKWKDADEYAEKVLDIDPENAKAYLAKLMVQYHAKNQEELKNVSKPFDNNAAYKNLIKFADESLKSTLAGYIKKQKIAKEKRKRKIITAIIVTISLVMISLALWFFTPVGAYSYTPYGNGYSISCNKKFIKNANIPAKHMGKPVVYIEPHTFEAYKNLETVTIPDSVTSIGNGAFYGCTSLTSIVIPESVTSIGDSAFSATSITSIEIPNSVTSIGSHVFAFCDNLNNITIPKSVTDIGYRAFRDCTSLTSIEIPDSVTSIGKEAFVDCSSLTSVVIGDSVMSIGEAAFSGCKSLASVVIGDSVTSIGDSAFWGCHLTSIVIPDSVVSIGDRAFKNCSSLTSVVIGDYVGSIGEKAFADCSSLTSVVIGDSVMSIGDDAFYDCTSLTSIEIPASVTSIGFCAFYGCSSLTQAKFINSYGWFASYDEFSSVCDFSSSNIKNSKTAAKYLTTTWVYAYWKCTK